MATTVRRKNSRSSARGRKASVSRAIDRPFDPAILKRAKSVVADYQLVIWQEDGEWCAKGVEVPNAFAAADSLAACEREWREVCVTLIAYGIEKGEEPPPAAREGVRSEQVNMRVSSTERLALETRVLQGGHKGISDYIRSVVLSD